MTNREKRSIVLSLTLGDGCLFSFKRVRKNRTILYGGFTVAHGPKQKDYCNWKAQLLSKLFDRNVKQRISKKNDTESSQCSIAIKRMRSWRKFCYPNNRKSIPKLLKFIEDPKFALAVWLMDDGYVCPSLSKLKSGENKLYGARMRLFINSQNEEEVLKILEWFEKTFNFKLGVSYVGKKEPYLKFSQEISLQIWKELRDFILQFDSMKYKFRFLETTYQTRCLQRQTVKFTDDIVDTNGV